MSAKRSGAGKGSSEDPGPENRSKGGSAKDSAEAASSSGEPTIPELRKRINEVDAGILKYLAQRRNLSAAVARAKDLGRSAIRDQKREEELLIRLIRAGREAGLDAHLVTSVFHVIIDDSVRLQQSYLLQQGNPEDGAMELVRIAFQGIEGAYSHLAAKKYFAADSERLKFLGFNTFREVVEAVERGHADYAMLPIENTTSGGINEVYDLLLHTELSIGGEEIFRVKHCLVAADDVSLASIRKVYSHPQAVAQCSHFLNGLANCHVEYFTDTAMSVSKIKEDGDLTQAAIASQEAAAMFGLKVLRRDIANQKDNYTRFLIGRRQPREVDPRIPCKTSVIMATGQNPGALALALDVFRKRGINLTKIESRPILGNPWEEMFYLDFVGNRADENVDDAIKEITPLTRFIKVLGSYPSQDLPRTVPPPSAISDATRSGEKKKTPATPPSPVASSAKVAARSAYRLASRSHKPEDTLIAVRDTLIGNSEFLVIAGPGAVESYEQILACAREVKEHGGQILRGACFTSRSSGGSFEGPGLEALDHLVEAGRSYGLPVITEIHSPEDVQKVAERADILQVGARNMQNFALLREVGRIHRPVMLKRGLMASIDEFLQAAEAILTEGNQQVILCERGIRTFETAYQNTLDFQAVNILRQRSHLPVFVDPSQAAGERGQVMPLVLAAKAVGAQGVMVEIHPDPDAALADGPQSLGFPDFESLMTRLFNG